MPAKPKAATAPVHYLASAAAVGRYFGKTERTIASWKAAGMPVEEDGRYETGAIARWRFSRIEDRTAAEPSDNDLADRIKIAEVRKLEASAKITEMRQQKLAGELVEVDVVLASICVLHAIIRTRIQAIPGEVAPCFGPEIRGELLPELEHRLALVLTEMAAYRMDGVAREEVAAVQAIVAKRQKRIGCIVKETRRRSQQSKK